MSCGEGSLGGVRDEYCIPFEEALLPKFGLFESEKSIRGGGTPLLDLRFMRGVSSSQKNIQFDQLPKAAMASRQKQKFIQIYDI